MHIDEQDHLTRRRTKRILKRKGKKGVFKVQKRKAKRKVRRKKIVQKTVGAAALAPLLPFKRAMKKALEKKGVNTSKMKFRSIVSKFFNEFVSKKGNKKSSYDAIDEVDFDNDVTFTMPVEDLDYSELPDHSNFADHLAITTATISAVVAGIINLFKKAKERRQAAKETGMSDTELKKLIPLQDIQFGKDAEEVQAVLEEKEAENTPVTKMKMKKMIVYGVILAVLFGVLYFVSKKGR